MALGPSSTDARPTSSHGGDKGSSLRNSAFDKDKKLPPLPRYLVPAPLYACNSASSSPTKSDSQDHEYREIQIEDARFQMLSDHKGHFSIWSSESGAFDSPTSDDEDIHSPTFSSLTSDCSDSDSPHRYSRFSISDYIHSPDREATFPEEASQRTEGQGDLSTSNDVIELPPKLGELHLSSFGSDLFDGDLQHADTAPRRKVTCYGLGFQNYQLPEDENKAKSIHANPSLQTQPAIHRDRGSSVGQAQKLVNDFAFLGDAVI